VILHRTSSSNGAILVDTQESAVEPPKIRYMADSNCLDSKLLLHQSIIMGLFNSVVELYLDFLHLLEHVLSLVELTIGVALGHLLLVFGLDHLHLVELALGHLVLLEIHLGLEGMDSIRGSSILFKILRTSQQE
jgi:hypothetical protein